MTYIYVFLVMVVVVHGGGSGCSASHLQTSLFAFTFRHPLLYFLVTLLLSSFLLVSSSCSQSPSLTVILFLLHTHSFYSPRNNSSDHLPKLTTRTNKNSPTISKNLATVSHQDPTRRPPQSTVSQSVSPPSNNSLPSFFLSLLPRPPAKLN